MDDKIVCKYFGAVTREEIRWHDHVITPLPLIVSEMIFRGFTCPTNCGACCTQVATMQLEGGNTLDYLPTEERASISQVEMVEINGRSFPIYREDMHPLTTSLFPMLGADRQCCRHLTAEGRCGIYQQRSLACDLPLLQVTQYRTSKLCNMISIKKFGRGEGYSKKTGQATGWKRIDGGRNTMCQLLEITSESTEDTRRRLRRLNEWTSYFRLHTWMPEILAWAEQEPIPTQRLCLGFN